MYQNESKIISIMLLDANNNLVDNTYITSVTFLELALKL